MKTPFPDPSTDESLVNAPHWKPLGVWTTVGSVVVVDYCHGRGARCLSDRIVQTHQRTMNGETSSLDDRRPSPFSIVSQIIRNEARYEPLSVANFRGLDGSRLNGVDS
jgi:hypothetical protein